MRGQIQTGSASGEMREIMITMAAQRGLTLPYLRAWRLRRLLTQAELIEKSGVSRTTVVRAESASGSVSIANIRRLADALGVTPDDLVYTDPEARPNNLN
jgi:transcriptional regulator with XRE-family HTH domain